MTKLFGIFTQLRERTDEVPLRSFKDCVKKKKKKKKTVTEGMS